MKVKINDVFGFQKAINFDKAVKKSKTYLKMTTHPLITVLNIVRGDFDKPKLATQIEKFKNGIFFKKKKTFSNIPARWLTAR